MKKWIALVLIVSLLCTCGAFGALAEDSDAYSFAPSLANSVDATAVEWMGSAELRALATILLLLDVSITGDASVSADLAQPTYIGRDGENLLVYAHAEGGSDLLILYVPGMSLGTFTVLDSAKMRSCCRRCSNPSARTAPIATTKRRCSPSSMIFRRSSGIERTEAAGRGIAPRFFLCAGGGRGRRAVAVDVAWIES